MSKASLVREIRQYLQNGHNDIYDALAVEPTTICDHNDCPYCYMDCRRGVGCNMTMATARAIRKALEGMDIRPKEIWLPGGEPTACPRLYQIIEVLAPCSDYFAIVTNGLVLSQPEKVREILDNPQVKEVAVTLHSANKRLHNLIVGHDEESCAYDRAMRAIVNLSQAERPLTVAINLNINGGCDLAAIVNEVERRGGRIDKVMLQIVDFSSGRGVYVPMDDEVRELCLPTAEVVLEYFLQIRRLVHDGRIVEGMLIDPLPSRVLNEVNMELWSDIYVPATTPAISVGGSFRVDVVRRFG